MLLKKTVYTFNVRTGFITGTDVAVESPMQAGQGVFLIPAGATDVVPPPPINGKERRWTGETWEYVDAVPPEVSGALESVSDARQLRNALLMASDFTQLPDAPAWVNVQAWRKYRQLLRDVPQQAGFPLSINWPQPPAKS